MRQRFLTKSRFVQASKCPRKLYYADRPKIYENKNLDNQFLQALADGGFQVGALAKVYHPNGVEVEALDHQTALDQTAELLKQKDVTIYEAAFSHGNFFIRVDILVKKDNRVELIEVKAKSYSPSEDEFFDKRLSKKGVYKTTEKWRKYLYDVAYQTLVCKSARPNLDFHPYMMFADKSASASVNSLNQQFLLLEHNGRPVVKIAEGTSLTKVGQKILCKVDVKDVISLIINGRDIGEKTREQQGISSFEETAIQWANSYSRDDKMPSEYGSHCKSCEFRTVPKQGKISGFDECWSQKLGKDAVHPIVFDVWNFRKADSLLEDGKLLMRDLNESDIEPKPDGDPGMSPSERQWLQVKFFKNGIKTPHVESVALSREISSWMFPLHFIDFETTTVAIPFNAGRRPYEQIAFQFSHHVVHENGTIEHSGQYFNDKRGVFPNFDFVRALKSELQRDSGTILRYSFHENTVLCQIYSQLKVSTEPDRNELMEWIRTVTDATGSTGEEWSGSRSVVDMLAVLKRFYYHPNMNGSNSIKKVLPSILKDSSLLQQKYASPIYGSSNGIKSLNFRDWVWLNKDDSGNIIDPYKQLPKIFDGVDLNKLDFSLMKGDDLADGGAAMTAYAKMQFTEMSGDERSSLRSALLKYCELDTLAMVMIFEYWKDLVDSQPKTPRAA